MLPLLVFIGLPIAELILLIKAGEAFGFWWTVAWIFVSALIGITLVRHQGIAVIARARAAQEAGEVPVGAILSGVRLAFAGLFMIVPGFITDALGLLLLLPWTGNALGRTMSARVHLRSSWMGRGGGQESYGQSNGEIIDADYEVIRPAQPPAPDDAASPPAPRNGSPRNGNPRIGTH
jgi:UPF0716 protein FxsA